MAKSARIDRLARSWFTLWLNLMTEQGHSICPTNGRWRRLTSRTQTTKGWEISLTIPSSAALVPAAGADQEEEGARTAKRSRTCASQPRRWTPTGAARFVRPVRMVYLPQLHGS